MNGEKFQGSKDIVVFALNFEEDTLKFERENVRRTLESLDLSEETIKLVNLVGLFNNVVRSCSNPKEAEALMNKMVRPVTDIIDALLQNSNRERIKIELITVKQYVGNMLSKNRGSDYGDNNLEFDRVEHIFDLLRINIDNTLEYL